MSDLDIKTTQSTLTTEEWEKYVQYFGDGVEGDVDINEVLDLLMNPDEIPDGMDVEDLLMFYVATSETLPPDDPSLNYLWEDEGVQTALKELYSDYSSVETLQAQLDQVKAWLEGAGVAMDTMNQVADLVQDWIDTHGTLEATSSGQFSDLSEELTNLATLMKKVNPTAYLMLYMMYFIGPYSEEVMGVAVDKKEEIQDKRLENLDDMSSIDMQDEYATVDMKEIELSDKNLDQLDKLHDSIIESTQEMVNNWQELITNYRQSDVNTKKDIIRAFSR